MTNLSEVPGHTGTPLARDVRHSRPRLFHGGVPGLRPGDRIEPRHQRRTHDGCPWCLARTRGDDTGPAGIDPPSAHPDRVYLTPVRLYAAFYASMYGRGDVYRVEAIGELEPSREDDGAAETWMAPAARVIAAVDRAVLLTDGERRRLLREWGSTPWMEASR